MRHIGGKLLFIFKGILQLIHHFIKGMGHFMDLVISGPQTDPAG